MKSRLLGGVALLEGCFLAALGIVFLKSSQLVAGGTTGIALIADGLFDSWSFGPLFFLINLPFYWLGWRMLGLGFLLRTTFCVGLVSVMVELLLAQVTLQVPYALLSAVISGVLIAFGMVLILRAGGSLGGLNILGLCLQQRWGVPAARVILATDLLIMSAALLLYGWQTVLWSAVCVTLLGVILGRHYRPQHRSSAASEQVA
ncbi:YitT family protein [Motiliproteus sediminis]|uniref:YitT family protein n=1 Tax=Motiliproteus sediminis TaxID=1468178 RepID=UPI001AEFE661|nr:YitT family protein [Motiliproteus sediminis]